MKPRSLFLSVVLIAGTLFASAQDLSQISREQARQVVTMICQQSGKFGNQMEAQTGIAGIQNINSIVDDETLEMKYIVPGYNLGNTPEDQAYTLVCLAGGGNKLAPAQIDIMTGVFDKAGYNLRIVNTDGESNTCVVNLTPAQLNKIWKGDLAGAGVDRNLAAKGLINSLSKGAKDNDIANAFEDVKVYLDGNWATIEMVCREDSFNEYVTPDELKEAILYTYTSTPVIARMAASILPNEDFIGVKGLKVVYGKKSGDKKDLYISWKDMMNNY